MAKKTSFDLFGIILMAIAILLGNMLGGVLGSMIGFGGGILGTIMVGFVIYAIYTFITGAKIEIVSGLIFAACVWVANLLTGVVGGVVGIGGGLVIFILQVVFLSLIWGFIGAKRKGQAKAPISI